MRIVAITMLFTAVVCAQEFRGTFSGTVIDNQSAVVPQVTIVAIETRTGAKSETHSEASGAYTIPFLSPGEYEITAEAPGFKKAVRQGLTLGPGEHPVIDIKLEVGAVNESVTVTAESPLIESASASIGEEVTGKEVESFPVNGRVPLMLAQMAIGVTSSVEPGTEVRPFDNNTPASFSMGGAPSGTNELLYNGAPNSAYTNQMAYSPPQEAVSQIRVNVFESDSSFGHTAGGTANVLTKSGTNEFHGSVYEFFQHSDLAANQFFYNAQKLARPIYRFNQYGLTAGAPVWIPKVFNGKNKVFWFFAWEGLRDSDPATSPRETSSPQNYATVPTAAERQGDFSALLKLNSGGTNYSIYDPSTGVLSGSQVSRTPFPNNVIPSSRLNPIALNLLKYYPLPNTTGQANGFDNYATNFVTANRYNNELIRTDIITSDRNKLTADFRHSLRYALSDSNYTTDEIAVLAKGGSYGTRLNQGASLDDVYTITPTTVLDIRGNWTRYVQVQGSPTDGIDLTSLGFPSNLQAASEKTQLPYLVFTSASVSAGSESSFQSLGYNSDSVNAYDVFQLFGDVSHVRGNHTLKAGADLREYRWSAVNYGTAAGTFTFTDSWTNGPLGNAAASPLGQDFAAYLLGLPSSGSIPLNSSSTSLSKYYSFFLQDDWRAKSNLTINLGLRLEHETPTYERFDRAVDGFDPKAQNGIASAAATAYAANPISQVPASQFSALGGLTFAGAGSPAIYQTQSAFLSPRIGFAWTPAKLGSRTVIRGGFGLFGMPIAVAGNGETSGTVTLNQEGFSQTTQFSATGNNYLTPSATLSNPFPNGIAAPAGSSAGAATFLGQQVTFFNSHVNNPYSVRWNLGVQHDLPGQMVVEVVYLGNHAVHLPITTQLDFIPRQYLSTSILRDATTINKLTGSTANPFKGLLPNSSSLNGSTVALDQLLIPYPQYPVPSPPESTSNGVVMQGTGAGSSYFQSLSVRLQKRLTNGLTLIESFVWSQEIERVSYLNDSDLAPEKREATDSRPLREVLGATYELPIGRNKLVNLPSRWANTLLGGWNLNAMMVLQTGPVLTWGNIIYLGGPLNLNSSQPNGPAFDVTRFITASSQQPADNIRTFDSQFGNLRRASSENLDTSMSKNFAFGERRYVQIRVEAFNVTNHVTFGAPNTTPTSSAFGLISTQANSPRALQLAARVVW